MKATEKEVSTVTILCKHVAACNTRLKNTVTDMPIILLLRNCFPIDRHYFVTRLKKEGLLTEKQSKEFTNKNTLLNI